MDKSPEDFCESTDLLTLKYLKAYVSHSDLIVRVNRLLTQLQKEQANVSQAKDEEDSDLESNTSSYPELEGY